MYVPPGAICPLAGPPLSPVTVWAVLSLFVQVTVVPSFTTKSVGAKEKLLIVTALVVDVAGVFELEEVFELEDELE